MAGGGSITPIELRDDVGQSAQDQGTAESTGSGVLNRAPTPPVRGASDLTRTTGGDSELQTMFKQLQELQHRQTLNQRQYVSQQQLLYELLAEQTRLQQQQQQHVFSKMMSVLVAQKNLQISASGAGLSAQREPEPPNQPRASQ
jgi:hypothetical protein